MARKFEHNPIKATFKITEADFDDDFTNGKIQIIESGFNKNKSRFYTEDAIKNDIKIFEGVKMFINHDFDGSESKKHGARDLNSWVATVKTTEASKNSEGTIAGFGNVVIHDQGFRDKLKSLKESGVLDKVGVSIDAFGKGERRRVDGKYTNVIEGFVGAASVDFVTSAGAGGKLLSFKEAHNEGGNDEMKIEDLTIEELKESNPDFLKSLTDSIKESLKEEMKESDKEEDKKEEDKKEGDEKTDDKDVKESAEINKRFAQIDRKDLVISIVSESSLPKEAKDRIKESIFSKDVIMSGDKLDIDKTKNSISKAIESEENYIKQLTEAKVSNNGSESKENKTDKKLFESLENSFASHCGIEIKEGGDK